MLLYSVGLALALLVSAPWWLLRMLTTERYREGLRERLGKVPAPLRAAVQGRRTVWLHAVSVGEVLAASSLVAQLEARLGEELGSEWVVVLSTTTRTGQQLARNRFGADRVFYFPFDFGFAVRTWLRALQPGLVILTESELWPRLLHECAQDGVPVAVVNARVSDRTLRRSLRLRFFWKRMARHVTVWLPQSAEDAGRLVQLGAAASDVHITGNLKYDTRPPGESTLVSAVRSAAAGRPIVVAGSTVHYGTTPEEGIVLDAFRSHIWPEMPDALLILAPRHPERFAEVAALAAGFGTTLYATALLRSGTPATLGRTPGRTPETAVPDLPEPPMSLITRITERVLVLDTIGDLAALYRIADVAFVGGSLLPHGGHNPLEPAQFGVPVVMGPHVQNFRDIVARLRAAEGLVLLEQTTPGALGAAFASLLAEPGRAKALGERGRAVCEEQKGATARTVEALLPLLGRSNAASADVSGPESSSPELSSPEFSSPSPNAPPAVTHDGARG